MSAKKIKINVSGEEVEGLELKYKTLKEDWNEYEIEDGTILKFKTVVTRIVRTNKYNKLNEPIYAINSTNIASPMVPESLKKKDK